MAPDLSSDIELQVGIRLSFWLTLLCRDSVEWESKQMEFVGARDGLEAT
jgi:hypothetical protein